MFRSNVSPREDVARQREFKVMMDLKQENIVKFIAVEQEVTLRYVMWAIYSDANNDWAVRIKDFPAKHMLPVLLYTTLFLFLFIPTKVGKTIKKHNNGQ